LGYKEKKFPEPGSLGPKKRERNFKKGESPGLGKKRGNHPGLARWFLYIPQEKPQGKIFRQLGFGPKETPGVPFQHGFRSAHGYCDISPVFFGSNGTTFFILRVWGKPFFGNN